jgi:hypothetical protein
MQFDDLKEGLKKMNLGEFSGFCRDFEILIPRLKISDCFKKVSVNN